MMKIRNLGLKESLRIKFKGGKLKMTGIFIVLLNQDGFEND